MSSVDYARSVDPGPEVSVLVAVGERPDDLVELYRAHARQLSSAGLEHEFIFAFEPWNQPLAEPLLELARAGEPVRVVQLAHASGEATLVRSAASLASGHIFLTLPGYWRLDPAVIPSLVDRVRKGADLVLGRRDPRRDSHVNRLQTRLFHRLARVAGPTELGDLACGVRAFRPGILEEVPLYGDFFRFYPLLVARSGLRVEEVSGAQHPADVRTRVYAPGVYVRRLLDLLAVFFLLRFTEKPLRFFGLLGGAVSLAGGAILLVLLVQRLQGQGLADRPMMVVGVLLFALGVQAIALGLIGEILVFLNAPTRQPYRLDSNRDAGAEETDRESGAATRVAAR